MTMPRKFMKVSDVTELLGVATMTVYRIIDRGELRAYRVGRSIRIDPRDFAEYMRQADSFGEQR